MTAQKDIVSTAAIVALLLLAGIESSGQANEKTPFPGHSVIPVASMDSSGCDGMLGENAIPDGDFGTGQANTLPSDPGVAPGFIYLPDPPPNDGYYTITNNTSGWGWFADQNWIDIKDNSPDPNGYMMVVNANYVPGIFFEKSIAVCENTPYFFSADIINMIEPAISDHILPNIDFLVNGAVLFSSGNVPQDATWRTYGFIYQSPPGVAQVQITLRNNAPGGTGNDLALDNLSFRVCAPEAILPDSISVCKGNAVTIPLELKGGNFPTPGFQWQSSVDGGASWQDIPGAGSNPYVLNDPQPGQKIRVIVANAPGNFSESGCRIISTVTTLVLGSGGNHMMSATICAGQAYAFGDSTYTQSGTYEHSFASAGGCDSLVTLHLDVKPVGPSYRELALCAGESWQGKFFYSDTLLTDTLATQEGCDSISVTAVRILPTPEPLISGPDTICAGETATLDAGDFEAYQWSSGSNASRTDTNTPGTYTVTVTDANGCKGSATAQLDVVKLHALYTVSPPECAAGADGSILVTGVFGGVMPYRYGLNGQILQDTPLFDHLKRGIYSLIAEDGTGCRFETIVEIGGGKVPDVYVPNVFSPDDDGTNDYHTLFTGDCVERINRFEIFDRWGNQLFAISAPVLPDSDLLHWNGEFRGQAMPPGVYVWLADIQFVGGDTILLKGDVTIVK